MSRIYFHTEHEGTAEILGTERHHAGWLCRQLGAAAHRAYEPGTPDPALNTMQLGINTILKLGSDPLCLLARIHGQCEIHCYIEGHNRHWAADLIDQGLHLGLYRSHAGWEQLTELLRNNTEHPVVCSYSVTGGFPTDDPDAGVDGLRRPPPQWGAPETWDKLPATERWKLNMAHLRAAHREVAPNTLRETVGHRVDYITLTGRTS